MAIDPVSSPATFVEPDVTKFSLPVRAGLALCGGILGAARAVFPVVGLNGVDLFDRSTKATKTITPMDVVSGRLYGDDRMFDEVERVPGLHKTLAWSAAGAVVGAAVALAPEAAPLLSVVAGKIGTDAVPAVIAAGAVGGAAARAVMNVYVTGAIAALYGGVRGALIMFRGTPYPLVD